MQRRQKEEIKVSRMDLPSSERLRLMKEMARVIRELERLSKELQSSVKPLERVWKQLLAVTIHQRMDVSILEKLVKKCQRLVKQLGRVVEQFEIVAKQYEILVNQFNRRLKQLEGGRIKHYSSSQKILLVGEGDFSFALCLAKAFGFAHNMVATSLDSRGSLMRNYSKAMSNLLELEARECKIFHEVDACSMRYHRHLVFMRFDRIIYNFPHAGYLNGSSSSERNTTQICHHQILVREFFISARFMLTTAGEIHVTHKTTYPFSEWKLVEIAEAVGLYLVGEERFLLFDYPGYENKRGAGICDQTFPVGMSSTFRFANICTIELCCE